MIILLKKNEIIFTMDEQHYHFRRENYCRGCLSEVRARTSCRINLLTSANISSPSRADSIRYVT